MNIKSYLFRLTIAAIAFISGFSAQRGFEKLEQFSLDGLGSAVTAVKKFLPFQNFDEKAVSSRTVQPKRDASYDFAGEWYLSEEELPSGLANFGHMEFKMHSDPDMRVGNAWLFIPQSGGVHADTRTYKFTTISIHGEDIGWETEVIDGICYKFFGRSLRDEHGVKNPYRSGVGDITGKLEKWRSGSLIATIETNFYLFNSRVQIR